MLVTGTAVIFLKHVSRRQICKVNTVAYLKSWVKYSTFRSKTTVFDQREKRHYLPTDHRNWENFKDCAYRRKQVNAMWTPKEHSSEEGVLFLNVRQSAYRMWVTSYDISQITHTWTTPWYPRNCSRISNRKLIIHSAYCARF